MLAAAWNWLRKNSATFLIVAFVLVGICGLTFLGTITASYAKCEGGDETANREESESKFFQVADTLFTCEGVALDANAVLLTALATIIMAAFTGTLWRSSAEQARLTRDAISLSSREFIATHRPKIIVRNFEVQNPEMVDGQQVQPRFWAQNIGETNATIWEINTKTILVSPKRLRGDIPLDDRREYAIELDGGQSECFFMDSTCVPKTGDTMKVFAADNLGLFCLGVVRYRDDNGTERETGFIRRWDNRLNVWHKVEGSDYEFAF